MVEGRENAAWERTGQIWALLANVHAAEGSQPASPDDINPYAEIVERPKQRNVEGVKQAFFEGRR